MAAPNMDQFEEFFRRADLDGDGRISGAEAINFFQGSNLPKHVLANVWTHVDKAKTGFLGRTEFFNALRLVTVAQSKRDLTPNIVKSALFGPAAARIPAPQINLATIALQQSNESDGSNSFSLSVDEIVLSGHRINTGKIDPRSEIEDHTTSVLSEQQILQDEEIDIDLKSLSLKEVDEIYNRPKNGAIYDEVSANWITIKERLKFLSKKNENLSIDEAIEIYDASVLLKLMRKHEDEFEKAGKMARSGVLLMLQAETLSKKGRELLAMSKTKLQIADIDGMFG
ncbi:actin cytoskeleton-regulatory complex protein PAN1-like [Trifolium medium]|uniref:Actin cytoskeleton-regulatory complex protein PAN1-like n=1 Tax=Trifolium medium TaxID=97028 RepID=A0A392LWV9_9FABA|nr:actin cytoskeleton-regulatory complex protein PAN1-like [Trifolium medium]